jgi:fructosamine-3-kinase
MPFASQIEDLCKAKIIDLEPLSGGDINNAFKVHTNKGYYFLKTNRNRPIIQTEYFALDYILKKKKGIFPELLGLFESDSEAGILMQFISKSSTNNGMKDLAIKLASLHSIKSQKYGFVKDNYIGKLPQYNNTQGESLDWPSYFWKYRLLPQLRMAVSGGYYTPAVLDLESHVYAYLIDLHQDDPCLMEVRLIHGDLWSGNYIMSSTGAFLIDPAISYGHPWMDLAMTQLFGGFTQEFYQQYGKRMNIGPIEDALSKSEFYQVYYLLAHLNMFGRSYKDACDRLLSRAIVLR